MKCGSETGLIALQVKVVCQFKGREMDFKDLAFKLFQKFIDDIGEVHVKEPFSCDAHFRCYCVILHLLYAVRH